MNQIIENIKLIKDFWWTDPGVIQYLPESEKWTKEELVERLIKDSKSNKKDD